MRTMIGFTMAALLATAAQGQVIKTTAGTATPAPAKANEFEGAYTITAGEEAGKASPEEHIKDTSVRITGDTIVVADKDDKELYVAKYKLGESEKGKPISITMTETGGPRGRKGAKAVGIIEKDGDTVKLCYCYEGGIVPTQFKTTAGEKQLCFTMKKK